MLNLPQSSSSAPGSSRTSCSSSDSDVIMGGGDHLLRPNPPPVTSSSVSPQILRKTQSKLASISAFRKLRFSKSSREEAEVARGSGAVSPTNPSTNVTTYTVTSGRRCLYSHSTSTSTTLTPPPPLSSHRLVPQFSFSLDEPEDYPRLLTETASRLDLGRETQSTSAESESSRPTSAGIRDRAPRFNLRRLQNRTSSSLMDQGASNYIPVWSPIPDSCSWRSVIGSEVYLFGTKLQCLSPIEREALVSIAGSKLQRQNIGCSIQRPKDDIPPKNKRHKYVKKKAHTVSLVEKGSSSSGKGQVFGIPLSECLENDVRKATITSASATNQTSSGSPPAVAPSSDSPRCRSLDLDEVETLQVATKSLGQRWDERKAFFLAGHDPSEGLSADSYGSSVISKSPVSKSSKSSLSDQGSSSCDSAPGRQIVTSGYDGSSSVDTQGSAEEINYNNSERMLTSSAENVTGQASPTRYLAGLRISSAPSIKPELVEPHVINVPRIVAKCCDYLEARGLNTAGLFRVSGSTRRCREMRIELDAGGEISLSGDEADELYPPHDIATLLKEYFRDLPNPLLSKELYPAFLCAARLPEQKRIETIRYLIALLPTANTDTLTVLLRFLNQVAKHSYDTVNDDGVSAPGNRMDSRNLARIFAPTVLRPPAASKTQQQNALSDSDAAIATVECMINNSDRIFLIPKELHHDILKVIAEAEPEAADVILMRMSTMRSEPDPGNADLLDSLPADVMDVTL